MGCTASRVLCCTQMPDPTRTADAMLMLDARIERINADMRSEAGASLKLQVDGKYAPGDLAKVQKDLGTYARRREVLERAQLMLM